MERRYGLLLTREQKMLETVEKYERKTMFYMGKLIAARKRLKAIQARKEMIEREALEQPKGE